ncbi:MAG TPA: septal ring lytic transglycosylase RlpA family protein [Gammaproteobacteria bacterium]|nr:septal ring lytic transglycosylase RlpA family protein [Gammaproteobacteria bacterium]HRP87486.1 septal ring lytic transglycosylase RlpA family protein [Gammaproteobacteria bacterium]
MRLDRGWHSRATALLAALAVVAGCTPARDGPPAVDVDGAPARPPDVTRIPDPVPRAEPRSARGNPPFYEVMGRRYYVMKEAAGYRERGIASWYGTKFHGRTTSSGEPYDMYAMTAAHKTLPLPSYVRVTHRGNGRSIIVRVNDRGPFVGDRIIDLSYAAAVRLGMHNEGTALVDVELIEPDGPPPVVASVSPEMPPARAETVWLQVGAFSDERNAARLRERLAGKGINDVVLSTEQRQRHPVYRVRIGPLSAVEDVERMLERVRELGIRDAHLAMD